MSLDTLAISQQCKALGDPVRVRIIQLLPRSPNCEHRNNVSQLSELLGLSQPTLSHHLKILKQTGLVECKKMCRDVFYWVNEEKARCYLNSMYGAFNISLDHPEPQSTTTAPPLERTLR